MSLWDDVKQNLVSWYGTAANKTGEMTKVGLRRYDIFGLSREIERQFGELGSHVYTALNSGRTDFADDEVFDGLVQQIRDLEAQLADKEKEIQSIHEEAAAEAERKRAAAAAAAAAPAAAAAAAPAPSSEQPVEDAVYEPVDEPVEEAPEDPEENPEPERPAE